MRGTHPLLCLAFVVLGGADGDAVLAGSGRADGGGALGVAGVAGGEKDDKIVHLVRRLIGADGRGGVGVDVRAPAIGVDARAVVVVDVEEVARQVVGHLQPRRIPRTDVGE